MADVASTPALEESSAPVAAPAKTKTQKKRNSDLFKIVGDRPCNFADFSSTLDGNSGSWTFQSSYSNASYFEFESPVDSSSSTPFESSSSSLSFDSSSSSFDSSHLDLSSLSLSPATQIDGFGAPLGQDIMAGGLFEGGLFDEPSMHVEPTPAEPIAGPSTAPQEPIHMDSDDSFGGPPSMGAASPEQPPSPLEPEQPLEPEHMQRERQIEGIDQTTLLQNSILELKSEFAALMKEFQDSQDKVQDLKNQNRVLKSQIPTYRKLHPSQLIVDEPDIKLYIMDDNDMDVIYYCHPDRQSIFSSHEFVVRDNEGVLFLDLGPRLKNDQNRLPVNCAEHYLYGWFDTTGTSHFGLSGQEPIVTVRRNLAKIRIAYEQKTKYMDQLNHLIVDETTKLNFNEMKAHFGNSSWTKQMDLAPSTKRLMHWKETGGVEKLLSLPGRPIPSLVLQNNENMEPIPFEQGPPMLVEQQAPEEPLSPKSTPVKRRSRRIRKTAAPLEELRHNHDLDGPPSLRPFDADDQNENENENENQDEDEDENENEELQPPPLYDPLNAPVMINICVSTAMALEPEGVSVDASSIKAVCPCDSEFTAKAVKLFQRYFTPRAYGSHPHHHLGTPLFITEDAFSALVHFTLDAGFALAVPQVTQLIQPKKNLYSKQWMVQLLEKKKQRMQDNVSLIPFGHSMYYCYGCKTGFGNSKKDLMDHYNEAHPADENGLWWCSKCEIPVSFVYRCSWNKHMKSFHVIYEYVIEYIIRTYAIVLNEHHSDSKIL